jgi:prepilin-type N-terminal cleavage/methylation domain-containing protein
MSTRGFTLIEAAVAMAVGGLILSGAVLLTFSNLNDSREEETIEKLMQLKRAMVGDPRIVTKESRTDFGYLGDTGTLPPSGSLDSLWIKPSAQSEFSFDTTLKVGRGWQGPYMPVGPREYFNQIALDAWGNGIVYVAAAGTSSLSNSSVTLQDYNARLLSYGPDGSSGGNDDMTVEIYKTEIFSKVVGYVRDATKNPLTGVNVTMNFPNVISGESVIDSRTAATDANGAYEFNDIALGNRSIKVQPRLVYVVGTGVTSPSSGANAGTTVEFVVQNFSSANVTFNCFIAEFDKTAYYETLKIGNTTVFSSTSNRAASAETVRFAAQPQTVAGANTAIEGTFPIRIQSSFTQVPDQIVGENASTGGSVRLTMGNFVSAETTSGTNVNMTQVSFKVTMAQLDGTNPGNCTVNPSITIFSPAKL